MTRPTICYLHADRPVFFRGLCKECYVGARKLGLPRIGRQHCRNHPEKVAVGRGRCSSCYNKWLRKTNPAYAEQTRMLSAAWKKTRPVGLSKRQHRKRTLLRHGLTIESAEKVMEHQGWVCAICGSAFTPGGRRCVDHDHTSGFARGFLCNNCNAGIGHLRDSVALLTAAIVYLQKPPAADYLTKKEIVK